jgi:hypothetical protein
MVINSRSSHQTFPRLLSVRAWPACGAAEIRGRGPSGVFRGACASRVGICTSEIRSLALFDNQLHIPSHRLIMNESRIGSEQKAGRELFPSRGPSQTKTARRRPFPDFCATEIFGCGWGCCIFSPQRTQRTQRREGRGMKWERAVVWGSVAVRANGSLTLAALRRDWDFGASARRRKLKLAQRTGGSSGNG